MANDKIIITGPEPCPKCGQSPVVVKFKRGHLLPAWRVSCPWLDCDNHASAYGETELQAVNKWNRGEVVNA
jgi:hypothetical protein